MKNEYRDELDNLIRGVAIDDAVDVVLKWIESKYGQAPVLAFPQPGDLFWSVDNFEIRQTKCTKVSVDLVWDDCTYHNAIPRTKCFRTFEDACLGVPKIPYVHGNV